jgi:hypothetical protein
MVFENQYLLERDKADFYALFEMCALAEKIEYHVGIDFKPVEKEVIIIDEADCFILDKPVAFLELISANACICFTATPSNNDPRGSEA